MSDAPLLLQEPGPTFLPAELQRADEFLGSLWQVDAAALPQAAQARFEEVGGQEGTALAVARDAMAYFGAGLQCARTADYQAAFGHWRTSAQAFATVKQKNGFVVSSALAKFCEGVVEGSKGNIQAAREIMSQAEDLLNQAGGLGRQYQRFLDHLKPDMLFITAMSFLQRQDYETGRVWIEQAAAAATRVAERDLIICRYDNLVGRTPEFRQRSSTAIEALEKADAAGILPRGVLPMARGIRDTLDVVPTIAEVMTSVFQSTFKPDIPQLAVAKKGVETAVSSFASAGETAVPMLKQIQLLAQMIDNVQLLVKPTGKDIVGWGGIVTAVIFVPILFGVSWTNDYFHWGAPPLYVDGLAFAAAMVAGFGTSALKYLPALIGGGKSPN